MKKSRIITVLFAVVFASALMFTACNRAPADTPAPPPGAPAAPGTPGTTPGPGAGDGPEGEWLDNGLFRYHELVEIEALAAFRPDFIDDPADAWLWRWIEQEMNIRLNVTGIPEETARERTHLMFAARDYPEIIMMWPGIGLPQLAQLGDRDGQLIPFCRFFTPDYAPNTMRVHEEVPMLRLVQATGAGKLYGPPMITDNPAWNTNPTIESLWFDRRVLEAVGWDRAPDSTCELLELLRDIKAQDPLGLGSQNFPLAGSLRESRPMMHLLAAFGINTQMGNLVAMFQGGQTIIYSTGEPDHGIYLPFRTHPNYRAFLEYMHTLFREELIHPDFFSIEVMESRARIGDNMYGVAAMWSTAHIDRDNWMYWFKAPPLLSPYSDERIYVRGGFGSAANFAFITDHAQNPGAVVRMLDPMFDPRHRDTFYWGPQQGVHDTFGIVEGWFWDENGRRVVPEWENNTMSFNQYTQTISVFGAASNTSDRRTDGTQVATWSQEDQTQAGWLEIVNNVNPFARRWLLPVIIPDESLNRFTDLQSVLVSHADGEMARFITGARPLNDAEWERYVQEMYSMGYQEFVDIHLAAFIYRYGMDNVQLGVSDRVRW